MKNAILKIMIVVFVLQLAVSGWAADTYFGLVDGIPYYNTTGFPVTIDDTNGDMEEAHASLSIGDTLYVQGGTDDYITYSGTQIDSDGGLLTGQSGTFIVASGLVELSMTGDTHIITINDADTYVGGFRFTNVPSKSYAVFINQNGVVLECCDFSGGYRALYMENTNCIVRRSKIHGYTDISNVIPILGSSNVVFEYTSVYDNASAINCTAGTATFVNCNFFNNTRRHIDATSTGNVVATNCIFLSSGFLGGENYAVKNSGTGSFTISDSLCNPAMPGANPILFSAYSNITDGGNNIGFSRNEYTVPEFKSPRYDGILVLTIDDTGNREWFEKIAAEADKYGIKITWSTNVGTMTSADYDATVDEIQRGHYVDCQQWGGAQVKQVLSDLIAFTVDGPANSDLVISQGAITCYEDDKKTRVLVGSYTNIGQIVSAINALQNWTAAIDANVGSTCLFSGLADCDVATDSSTNILFDLEKFLYDELLRPKLTLEAEYRSRGLSDYTVTTASFHTGASNEKARDYLKDNDFLGARSNTAGYYDLRNMDIFDIYAQSLQNQLGTTHVATMTSALSERLANYGGIYDLYTHHSGEFSLVNWQAVLATVAQSNLKQMTLSDAVAYLRAKGSTTDGERFAAMLQDNADYNISPLSLCVGAGVSVAEVHERSMPAIGLNGVFEHFLANGVDIGAYPVDDHRMTIPVTTYAPTGYDVRGTADSPAKIIFQDRVNSIDTSGLTLDEPIKLILSNGIASGGTISLKSNHNIFEVEGCVPKIGAIEFYRYNAGEAWTNVLCDISQVQTEENILLMGDRNNQFVAVCQLDDPGTLEGENVDWWIILVTPSGEMWSLCTTGWVQGLRPVFTGPLIQFDRFGVYWTDAYNAHQSAGPLLGFSDKNYAKQPGSWLFAFGIDDEPNGKLDGNIYYDMVSVTVPE